MAIFTDIFEDVTKYGKKIPTSEYLESGKYPIIDQGQNDIAGYTNEEQGLFTDVPVVIFGDHTRAVKFVDTPFFLGADGVKVLKSKINDVNYKYLYYAVSAVRIPNTGYNRHFKWLKEADIPIPSTEQQLEIVKALDEVANLIALHNDQLTKLDELVKARFVEMFGDPKCNKINLVKIGEIGALTSGGTPSRTKPEYFEGEIRWYSAGELNSLYLSDSVEHISEAALQQSSAKLFNKGTLMIGMYDTAAFKMGILTEDSSSNQACANLNPKKGYNIVWLYYLFDIMKPIFLHERQGVRQKNLSLSKIKEFEVPVAPFELQNQFAAFVEQVDKSKFAVQQSLDKLETLKKSLMQKYFG